MAHILLVLEPGVALLRAFRSALAGDGMRVITGAGRQDALARAAAWLPDAALIGPGFGEEALEVVRALWRDFGVRAIVAVDIGDEGRVVRALEAGAVGYVTLPVARPDLVDRVRELLTSRATVEGHYMMAGPVTLDLDRHALVRPRPRAALAPCEFEILRWLLLQPGRTFTRRQLMATDRAAFPPRADDRWVDRHVSRLRAKLGEDGALIEQCGAVGWRISLSGKPLTTVKYEV